MSEEKLDVMKGLLESVAGSMDEEDGGLSPRQRKLNKYKGNPEVTTDTEQLWEMKVGDQLTFVSSGPEDISPITTPVHRVPGGWNFIYPFEEDNPVSFVPFVPKEKA